MAKLSKITSTELIRSHHFKQAPFFVDCLKSDKNEPQNLLVTTLQIALRSKSIKMNNSSEVYLKAYQDKIDSEVVNKIIKNSDGFAFDKMWIVFDADDNLGIKQVEFGEVYQNAKIFSIQIAYSVRQWEDWMILHFEKCNKPFLQSQCKDSLKKPVICGNTTAIEDCKGEVCAAGYLRENNYHKEYKKGDWKTESRIKTHQYCYEGLFDKGVNLATIRLEDEENVFDKIKNAIFNAHWQRFFCNFGKIPPNVDVPYTDVDSLVANLMQVKTNYAKSNFEDENVKLSYIENSSTNCVEIRIKNKSDKSIIFNQASFDDQFLFFAKTDKKITTTHKQVGNKIVRKDENFLIEIPISDFSSSQLPFYIKFKIFQEEIIIFL